VLLRLPAPGVSHRLRLLGFLTSGILANAFEGLTNLDANMRAEPALAVSWDTPGPTTWRFRLHAVRFQDGRPLAAADVVWSLDREEADRMRSEPCCRVVAQPAVVVEALLVRVDRPRSSAACGRGRCSSTTAPTSPTRVTPATSSTRPSTLRTRRPGWASTTTPATPAPRWTGCCPRRAPRVMADLPMVPLVVPYDLYAARRGIAWTPRLDGRILAADLAREPRRAP